MPSYSPAQAGERALAEFDTNKDGSLDAAELARAPGLQAALPRMDASGDGLLTADEISSRVAAYHSARTGYMPLSLTIVQAGQPLAGAEVTLTPEPLLAGAVKPATGTTSASGVVAPKIEGSEFSGVNPGVYRVAVSKKDGAGRETLSEKFNTATTLGIEAATDVPGLERGATLDLK
jgi:hypothetical protein